MVLDEASPERLMESMRRVELHYAAMIGGRPAGQAGLLRTGEWRTVPAQGVVGRALVTRGR